MISKCPNKDCLNYNKDVDCQEVYYYPPELYLDGIGNFHLRCKYCGFNFNQRNEKK